MTHRTLSNRGVGRRPSHRSVARGLVATAALGLLASCARPAPQPAIRLRVETARGGFTVELDGVHAPATVANFLRYVDAGLYDGGRFHRTVRGDNQPGDAVRIDVIQGGIDPARSREGFPPIALEPTSRTGLGHRDGTLSMARSDPDTATSDFFVCIGDQPGLDEGGRRNPDGRGFAAFGRVIEGMAAVRTIHAAGASGQRLDPPVRIESIRRLAGGSGPAPAPG